MIFCHRYNLSKGDSVFPKLTDIQSSKLAFKRKTSCAPRLTWTEYDGTSKVGIWFPNMGECRFSWSQSSWAMRSCDLRPLIEANSNGPWMKVCQDVIYWAICEMEQTCGGWHMKLKNPTIVSDSSSTLGVGTECPTSRDIEASTSGWWHYNTNRKSGRCRIQKETVSLACTKDTAISNPQRPPTLIAIHVHHSIQFCGTQKINGWCCKWWRQLVSE